MRAPAAPRSTSSSQQHAQIRQDPHRSSSLRPGRPLRGPPQGPAQQRPTCSSSATTARHSDTRRRVRAGSGEQDDARRRARASTHGVLRERTVGGKHVADLHRLRRPGRSITASRCIVRRDSTTSTTTLQPAAAHSAARRRSAASLPARPRGALVSRAALVPGSAPHRRRRAHRAKPAIRASASQARAAATSSARLGTAFNTMLGALEESIETQRRFVADASHELRTPLTSLQTNIEVLKQQERLQPGQRNKLFADLEREAHEMRDLITGLLELARGDANLERSAVQFDELVESAVERARSRFPNVKFNAELAPTTVSGVVRAARARRLEPARERRQVEPARRDRRRHARRRRAARARPRSRHRAERQGARLRPLLSFRRRAIAARLRARPRDRARGRGSARRQRLGGGSARRRRASPVAPGKLLGPAHLRLVSWKWPHRGPPWRFLRARCSLSPGAGAGPYRRASAEEAAALGELRLGLAAVLDDDRAPTDRRRLLLRSASGRRSS